MQTAAEKRPNTRPWGSLLLETELEVRERGSGGKEKGGCGRGAGDGDRGVEKKKYGTTATRWELELRQPSI